MRVDTRIKPVAPVLSIQAIREQSIHKDEEYVSEKKEEKSSKKKRRKSKCCYDAYI